MEHPMNMNRAYSVLDIKAVDDDKRVITGIATTPEPDRMQDVVDPMGATFKNPLPLLWQHMADKPVGTVVFDKPTKKGITFTATLPVIPDPGPLKDLVDMAWQAVRAQLVRGVSIGFRALKYGFLDTGGIQFDETEIIELSLVTIPANASATIQAIKSIDASLRAVTGIVDAEIPSAPSSQAALGRRAAVALSKSGVSDDHRIARSKPVLLIKRTRS
jgi:HK97 family phage prohead protease